MGNTTSNGRIPSTVPSSPVPSALASTHKSLRTKKKSLELPDLASLAITPTAPRQLIPSQPIPIPVSPNPNPRNHQRPRNVPEESTIDMLVAPPSTHIPLHPPSTRSESSARESPVSQTDSPFVPEIVHSTIPIALLKPSVPPRPRKDDRTEAVSVKITWRGGGRAVILIRSGDDNWKGRQPMEKESDHTWVTWVTLLPGTHHLKFIVDDQVRIADDLPKAVDDEGSLANYVAVPISPRSSPHSVSPPRNLGYVRNNSFWSEASSTAAQLEAGWVNTFPPELLAAAKEEEAYLASLSHASSSQPAPNIPPAPVLPRHLGEPFLNSRAAASTEQDRRRSSRHRISGMNSGGSGNPSPVSSASDVVIPVTTASGTDVTATAKQTHPHATRSTAITLSPGSGSKKLDSGTRMADDASVLPVPSHVVLHHLTTSTIKNGVLAVASTVRYKKKFITSVYYKPT